jgi:SAM-dependent methyltransferase
VGDKHPRNGRILIGTDRHHLKRRAGDHATLDSGLLCVPIMANEFQGLPGHSAERFGETRDHWWHEDFFQMVANRWRLEEVRSVLDVGCGVGHWGRLLARVLPVEAQLVGVDREPSWPEAAMKRAADAGLQDRFTYRQGLAETVPFANGTFDLVTCQTLLLHVPDPARVLSEMVRVTRPGGLVLVAEPTNATSCLVDSIALGDSAEVAATLTGFLVTCMRGKKALGQGDDLIGEALPGLFARAALRDVEVRLNDHAWVMTPPYASPDQRAERDEILDNVARDRWAWDEAATREYHLAGGGAPNEFPSLWQAALDQGRRVAEGLRAGTFSRAGGTLFYLAWGRKD